MSDICHFSKCLRLRPILNTHLLMCANSTNYWILSLMTIGKSFANFGNSALNQSPTFCCDGKSPIPVIEYVFLSIYEIHSVNEGFLKPFVHTNKSLSLLKIIIALSMIISRPDGCKSSIILKAQDKPAHLSSTDTHSVCWFPLLTPPLPPSSCTNSLFDNYGIT